MSGSRSNQGIGNRPFLIGVTGAIGCGKSAVMNQLERLGAQVIDADHVYHRLIQPSMPLADRIIDQFGVSVRDNEGGIDRRQLGAIVFHDPEALVILERLTHPAIFEEIRAMIAQSNASVIAVDAVKLLQGRIGSICDEIWLVVCKQDDQISRIMRRNEVSYDEARRRVEASPVLEPDDPRVDVTLHNMASVTALEEEVSSVWKARGLQRYIEADA